MNTHQLECCISCDFNMRISIAGVFAADRLPSPNSSFPYGFIMNTDPHNMPGKHWCAIYMKSPGHVEFFDSFGQQPKYYNNYFPSWIKSYSQQLIFNDRQIQGPRSDVCGQYCLFYLKLRLTGKSMLTIFVQMTCLVLNIFQLFFLTVPNVNLYIRGESKKFVDFVNKIKKYICDFSEITVCL